MRIVLLLLTCVLSSCSPFRELPSPAKVPQDREEVTWVIERIMADWRYKRHQRLRLEHAYMYYGENFTNLRLEISSQEILEVREARNLLVDLTEDILRGVNTDPIISSQLAVGSMQPDQLHIEISFESFFGRFVDPYFVGCIKLKNGMAYYYAFDLKTDGWNAWHSRVEPYAKTREISMFERAADSEAKMMYTEEFRQDSSEGNFTPLDADELENPSPFRKF